MADQEPPKTPEFDPSEFDPDIDPDAGRKDSFDELEIQSGGTDGDPPAEREESNTVLWIAAAVIAVLLLGFLAYWFYFRGEEPEAPAPPVTASAPEPEREEPEPEPAFPEELPELDASDRLVRELAAGLSAHPRLTSWLVNEDLVRRFTAVVDNIAEGTSPQTHLKFLEPDESFAARGEGARTTIDPASYERYNLFTEVIASLDAEGCAELYGYMKPLIQESYTELGYPNRDFDRTLKRAIDRLLDTPIRQGDISLVPGVSSYEFADPSLESLSEAQKQLIRMGPENAGRIQRKLRALKRELNLDDA